jgi:hypothetical protein
MKRVNYIVGVAADGDVLVPADSEARGQLVTLEHGEKVSVEITRPRQSEPIKFRAHIHLTLERVAAAMSRTVGVIWSVRALRGWLCIRTGRVDVLTWPPKSTVIPHAIEDMNALELEAFWKDACQVIIAVVLPLLATDEADDIRTRLMSWRELNGDHQRF